MLQILMDSLINLFKILGVFILFGLAFNIIQKINIKLMVKNFGMKSVLLTGYIGTVIHELSHLLVALVFRHRITKCELFRPLQATSDGLLGYVDHEYNKKSAYQQIGNFFIGIAPMIIGTAVIWITIYFLTPTIFSSLKIHSNITNIFLNSNDLNFTLYAKNILDFIYHLFENIISSLFLSKDILSFRYIIMILIVYSVSTHMTLSKEDLKGSLEGLISIYIIVILATIVIYILKIPNPFNDNALLIFNVYTAYALMIGLIFSVFTLMITTIISFIKSLI